MTITPDSLILNATPQATPEQCSRYLLARPHGEYTQIDIAGVIVPAYFAVCAASGIDPLLVIAQLIHETGNLTSWWSQRPNRNPAGVGVTGQKHADRPASGAWQWNDQIHAWCEGVAFPTWKDDAIPAHVGRLLAYALPDTHANDAQRALIARALNYRPLPTSYRGAAPTLRGLAGRWAVPGTTYPDKLAKIANEIRSMG
jgi:hypothetical protein